MERAGALCPGKAGGAGDVEKRGAKDVLGWMSVAAGIAIAGKLTANVVLPQAGLVAAKGAEPHRVCLLYTSDAADE